MAKWRFSRRFTGRRIIPRGRRDPMKMGARLGSGAIRTSAQTPSMRVAGMRKTASQIAGREGDILSAAAHMAPKKTHSLIEVGRITSNLMATGASVQEIAREVVCHQGKKTGNEGYIT
eukprot:477355-Amorphochlora_amoeboformis.AAC.1